MDRRQFTLTASGALGLGLAGCGNYRQEKTNFQANCTSGPTDMTYRADVHCHLMNFRDINTAEYINRRQFDPRKTSDSLRETVNLVNDGVRRFFAGNVKTARAEANALLYFHRGREDEAALDQLCREVFPPEDSFLRASDGTGVGKDRRLGDGRLTGFFSNRARNAAIMMAQFPTIDTFFPSIVDLYDGSPARTTDPARQVQFYTALNVATTGRFLPLVSFHPERYYYETRDLHPFTNLDLVRECITRLGFVGVKVHPSSGFDPLSTLKYGVQNTDRAVRENTCLDPYRYREGNRGDLLADKFKVMDQGMRALYKLCSDLDVPILTHGAPTLAVNATCMTQAPDPKDWTNSTHHWIEAIGQQKSRGNRNLRACLGHFAGGFGDMVSSGVALGDERGEYRYSDAKTPELIPSPWLQTVVDHYRTTRRPHVFLDMSIMTELALSQSFVSGDWRYRGHFNPEFRRQLKAARADGGQFAQSFTNFMRRNPKLARATMYGTDAHMPGLSAISGGDAYQQLIEQTLPAEMRGLKERVMGQNAADFFGLRRGRQSRRRLEAFYARIGTPLKDVRWIAKVDAWG